MEALAAGGSCWCYIPVQVCQQLERYCLEVPTLMAKTGVGSKMKVLAEAGGRGDCCSSVTQHSQKKGNTIQFNIFWIRNSAL